MDGPSKIDLEPESRGVVRLTCIARDRIVHHAVTAHVADLRKNAKSAALRLLRECYFRGWSDRDIDALRAIHKIS